MALNDDVDLARKTTVLFFLVDASTSMEGSKIGTLNHAIEEVIPEIRKISVENADAQIKIAVLEFSTGARWITKNPEPAETFVWQSINASGLTHMGEACRQLAKKLSTKEGGFMNEATGSYAPAIFMLSDGEPNDDFEEGLKELQEIGWFKVAAKAAIAIGTDANKKVLAEFVGSNEGVITAHDPQTLKQWIRFISVRASQVISKGSKTTNADGSPAADNSKQNELTNAIAGQAKTSGGVVDAATGTIDIPPAGGPEIW